MASFNDTRCVAGGVSLDDPLVFTCEISNAYILRVGLSNCYQDYIYLGSTADSLYLPAGFTAESLVTTKTYYGGNFSLTLSVANASLLNGGQITCDDSTSQNQVMAGCPLAGKPFVKVDSAK